jgi:hypothetical protein
VTDTCNLQNLGGIEKANARPYLNEKLKAKGLGGVLAYQVQCLSVIHSTENSNHHHPPNELHTTSTQNNTSAFVCLQQTLQRSPLRHTVEFSTNLMEGQAMEMSWN